MLDTKLTKTGTRLQWKKRLALTRGRTRRNDVIEPVRLSRAEHV